MIFGRTVAPFLTSLIGLIAGASTLSIIVFAVTIWATIPLATQVTTDGTRRIGALGLFLSGILLVGFRGLLGDWNLQFLPQGYRIEPEGLPRIEVLLQISVATTFASYGVFTALSPQHGSSTASIRSTIPIAPVRFAALALTTVRLVVQGFGVGVKGGVVAIPYGANLSTILDVFTPLAIVALLVDGFVNREKPDRIRLAIGLLIFDTIVVTLGGARGGVLDAGILLAATYFGTGGRLDFRVVLRAVLVGATVLWGLDLSIGRRLELVDGSDFGLIEFLAFRLPGFHRAAPVLHADVNVSWVAAVQPTTVKYFVYQLPESSITGVGSSWPALGFLAGGVWGMVLISSLFGAIFSLLDRRTRHADSSFDLAVYIFLTAYTLSAYSAARPRVEIRELFLVLTVYVFFRRRARLSSTSLRSRSTSGKPD